LLTILGAVACAEAVERVTGLPAELKWPNDLELGRLKIGGILVETEVRGGELQWSVIGIGLNANWDPAEVPEIAMTATSLSRAVGHEIARTSLLRVLLQRVDHHYLNLRAGKRDELFDAWRRRLTTIGQAVRIEQAGAMLEGTAEDVTTRGALIVRDQAGMTHELAAGEITLRRAR
jgi:BirA family biotin operon repressor/biotin-[acetyl-CoA-carboxylase] ligase